MMISPELFVKMHADETYEELLQLREELLDEIYGFEEDPSAGWERMPGPDVVYRMNLQYLGKLCELIAEKHREKSGTIFPDE